MQRSEAEFTGALLVAPGTISHPHDSTICFDWAAFLSEDSRLIQWAVRADDAIVVSLYGPHREHLPPQPINQRRSVSLLSPAPWGLSDQDSWQLRGDFDKAHSCLFIPGQTFDELYTEVQRFVGAHEEWCARAIGQGPNFFKAFCWSFGAFSVLNAPWSRIRISVPRLSNSRQLGLRAEVDIPRDTYLYEALGMLSEDPRTDTNTSGLSTMPGQDRVDRVLYGPIRLANHDCNPNVFFEFLFEDNPHAVILRTYRDIRAGEQLLVSYGPTWYHSSCPCAPCNPHVKPATRVVTNKVADAAVKRAAKRRKNQAARKRKQNGNKIAHKEVLGFAVVNVLHQM
ncbi:hypothetical protein R3P38DRAFT_2859948 [Favolaschia claudopus]|uniref:SET domain-containing protein n=1 Tax=Favolaschia claudopus TaxID=2862362 RepID=A0AAW0DL41_9AGAR